MNPTIMLLLVGLVAGFLASLVVRSRYGLIGDLIVGVLGSFIGGWLFGVLGIATGSGFIGAVIPALVGAILLLIVLRLFAR
jgi:uncharacterized membrane protein YeaQ/YmgE (transglycosylase-associated protein family)